MTLVLSIHSKSVVWVLTDRRLSYPNRPPKDDAVKLLTLETNDGVGILAYAGLGATPRGRQPSDWMRAVLRGRPGNLTFEEALGVLAGATNRELPKFLAGMPGNAHFILVPAFVNSIGARLYSIDNHVEPTSGKHSYRFTSHQRDALPTSPSPQIGLAGTGGLFLSRCPESWELRLKSIVKANDGGVASDMAVARELARINTLVHRNVPSVGPRSIVVWRKRKDLGPNSGGGAHQAFNELDVDPIGVTLPSIANGIDIGTMAGVMMSHFKAAVDALPTDKEAAPVHIDFDSVNKALGGLPSAPDETLR